MPTSNKSGFPIFNTMTIPELAGKLGVTEQYLEHIRYGYRNLGPQARARWALILGMTEKEIFGGK